MVKDETEVKTVAGSNPELARDHQQLNDSQGCSGNTMRLVRKITTAVEGVGNQVSLRLPSLLLPPQSALI